jgi:hypothetical protein
MKKYELIEKVLGLEIKYEPYHSSTIERSEYRPIGLHYVKAADLERALEKGVRVSGHKGPDRNWNLIVADPNIPRDVDTHVGLMVGITPIERDTAEAILHDLLEWEFMSNEGELKKLQKRAKKVLGEK